ncbi:coiled-coil domain-containing protein 196 isoform 2-T2 [Thomomys bottae]
MTSDPNPSGSYLTSNRNSKTDDTYLKELNEDLKQRKQELLEMLKPLEDKNNLLLQKLMSNLEEKQRSLQIMRQIMAGKGCDESSVMELIKEAEEMKQNLERKNKMLRKEMEMLWNKTLETEEVHDQQKATQIKPKADLQNRKRLFLPPGKATKEDGMGQVPGTSQHPSGTMGKATMGRRTDKNQPNVRILGSKTYTEQQEATESQSDDVGERLFCLRSLPDETRKD